MDVRPLICAAMTLVLLCGCSGADEQHASGVAKVASATSIAATGTPTVAATPTPSVTPTLGPTPIPPFARRPDYLDDRSSPQALISSYVNAIANGQKGRAFSYYAEDSAPAPFAQFSPDLDSVRWASATLGTVVVRETPGEVSRTVPAVIKEHLANGTTRMNGGCFAVRLVQPRFQVIGSWRPMAIIGESLHLVASETSPDEVASDCPILPGRLVSRWPAPHAVAPYIDDRTDERSLIRSLESAINRHEVSRVAGYWRNTGSSAGDQVRLDGVFPDGLDQVAAVALTPSMVTSATATGRTYGFVRVEAVVRPKTGASQQFMGCYGLEFPGAALSKEGFHGWAIYAADANGRPEAPFVRSSAIWPKCDH